MAMKISSVDRSILLLGILFFLRFVGRCSALPQLGSFDDLLCQNVESVISRVVSEKFKQDPTIAPALIRMFFHDCFVNGCDASILLDGTNSEKMSGPDQTVRGYDVIDDIKTALDLECSTKVSCADIIALAARDSVKLTSGTWYEIPMGRLDGFVSLASAAAANLPSPSFNVSKTAAVFASKGLNVTDMVLLLGGHSIGIAHCPLFQYRLYNFQNTGKPDPTMDPKLVNELKVKCPENSSSGNFTFLDQNVSSSNILDVSFYNQIILRRGILQIDQELALDNMTKSKVTELAGGKDFLARFGAAMVKMGSIVGAKNTSDGEIRRSCRFCNAENSTRCNTG